MNSFFSYMINRLREPSTYLGTGLALIGGNAGIAALATSGDRGAAIATVVTGLLGILLPERKTNG